MKENIVSLGTAPATAAASEDSDSWFGTATGAVVLTAVIFVAALAAGNGVTALLGISFGWTFPLAVVFIVAEIWAFIAFVNRPRARHANQIPETPKMPPMNRAA